MTFGDALAAAAAAHGPLCAGIDPAPGTLATWGLPDDAGGMAEFGLRCVEAFAGSVAVVKPQVAFFERHGADGVAALERVLAAARAAGVLTIADAKRGDIASTADAYATTWLGPESPLAADAVTVLPYMGLGALEPFFRAARSSGRGVFVVVRSSNPEGRVLQAARTEAGPSVEDALLAELARGNQEELEALATGDGESAGIGSVGAVIGATMEPSEFALAGLGGPILAPGVGAQGAGPADVARRFAGCPRGSVVPNVSRSLLGAGPDVDALRTAARRLSAELADALG